jgi:hypothetical protein
LKAFFSTYIMPSRNWGWTTWHEIHTFAADPPPTRAAIDDFFWRRVPQRIVCGACRNKYLNMLRQTGGVPKRDQLFAWTVRMHNDLNRQLHKPIVSLEDAKVMFKFRPQPPQPKRAKPKQAPPKPHAKQPPKHAPPKPQAKQPPKQAPPKPHAKQQAKK